MKKTLLFLLFIIYVASASAADSYTLVIELKSSALDKYLLADKPVITFTDGTVNVKSEKAQVEYAITDIARYYFVESGTDAIESLENDAAPAFSFRYINRDNISISGADKAEVYNTGGQKLSESKAENGVMTVSLSSLPSGVYVIKTNNKSIKIKK